MAETNILYGGQAVIEGVMMRGRHFVSCAVRRAGGEIILQSEEIPSGVYSGVWSKTPFLRALPLLWDTLVLGTRMLMFAANIQASDEIKKDEAAKGLAGSAVSDDAKDQKASAKSGTKSGADTPLPPAAVYGTLAISLAVGVGLFFVLPVLVANFLNRFVGSAVFNNAIEGVIRFVLFIGYLLLIGRLSNVQRLFQYHGAEHKTIAAYEAGSELAPDKIQPFSKEHPRCGTGFLLTIVVVSIFFFILLGDLPLLLRFASRILLIPVVAAVSYELIRFAANHRSNPLFDWLIVRPSLALQSLTTREPSNDMIEVAIAAFQDVSGKEQAAPIGA